MNLYRLFSSQRRGSTLRLATGPPLLREEIFLAASLLRSGKNLDV